jgi:hypothetical protein
VGVASGIRNESAERVTLVVHLFRIPPGVQEDALLKDFETKKDDRVRRVGPDGSF